VNSARQVNKRGKKKRLVENRPSDDCFRRMTPNGGKHKCRSPLGIRPVVAITGERRVHPFRRLLFDSYRRPTTTYFSISALARTRIKHYVRPPRETSRGNGFFFVRYCLLLFFFFHSFTRRRDESLIPKTFRTDAQNVVP